MIQRTVKVLILGAQIFAEEVADLVEETPGFEVKGFIENLSPDRCQAHLLGKPVLWVTELGNLEENCHLLCGIGTNRRREYVEQVKLYNLPVATLIHPSARVSQTSKVGTGGIISVNAVIAAHSSLGVHTIVNRGVLIGHHTQIGDYVTIAPGANIAGKCVVEDGCYISMGAVIIDRVRIGANSVVGAGAVVTKDVPANVQVVGIPARVVKEGVHGR
jgi:acetyltransferase EpsM